MYHGCRVIATTTHLFAEREELRSIPEHKVVCTEYIRRQRRKRKKKENEANLTGYALGSYRFYLREVIVSVAMNSKVRTVDGKTSEACVLQN